MTGDRLPGPRLRRAARDLPHDPDGSIRGRSWLVATRSGGPGWAQVRWARPSGARRAAAPHPVLVRQRARDAGGLRVRADVPELWDCPRCGLPAGQDQQNPPPAPRTEPYKTHLAYVRERRSDADGDALLEEALTRLHRRRGGLSAVSSPARRGYGPRECQLAVAASQNSDGAARPRERRHGSGHGNSTRRRATLVVRVCGAVARMRSGAGRGSSCGGRCGDGHRSSCRVGGDLGREPTAPAGYAVGRCGAGEPGSSARRAPRPAASASPGGRARRPPAARPGRRRPAPRRRPAALPSPETSSQTSSAALIAAKPRLTRVGGGLGQSRTATTGRSSRGGRRAPGRSRRRGPPAPCPSSSTSSRGTARAVRRGRGELIGVPGGGVLGLGELARRTAAWRAPGRPGRRPRRAAPRRACFSLRSSSSAGTKRSSPHQTSTAVQSTVSRPARRPGRRPARRTAMPMPPPVSTTDAVPCTVWAAASRATSA